MKEIVIKLWGYLTLLNMGLMLFSLGMFGLIGPSVIYGSVMSIYNGECGLTLSTLIMIIGILFTSNTVWLGYMEFTNRPY
jgi:hypothetical protein